MSEQSSETKRKRGIQASPAKLRKALVDANIKTQAELAEKIADIEGIDNPPKGLVNKIFRGQAVDLVSLERVAKALGVESWRLYLDSEEVDTSPDVKRTQNNPAAIKIWSWKLIGFGMTGGLVFALIGFFIVMETLSEAGVENFNELKEMEPKYGAFSLVLHIEEESLSELASEINSLSSRDFKINSVAGISLLIDKTPYEIFDTYSPELIVSIRQKKVGRHLGLFFDLYANDKRYEIWTEYSAASGLQKSLPIIAEHAVSALKDVLGLESLTKSGPFLPSTALAEYIKGRDAYDRFSSELNTRETQAYFSAVSRLAPDFALGFVALCDALANDTWQSDIESKLTDARNNCEKGKTIGIKSENEKLHYSSYLSASGQLEDSAELLESLLSTNNESVDLLAELAYVKLQLGATLSAIEDINEAYDLLQKAVKIEPDFWRIHSRLGNIYFFRGEINKAIESFSKVIDLAPSYDSYSNLGTMYLCQGELESAAKQYRAMIAMNPEAPSGYEMLATYYFFTDQLEQTIESMSAAIAKVEDQANQAAMWSVVGDSHRMLGNHQLAISAYEEAINILEARSLSGTIGSRQKIATAVFIAWVKILQGRDRDLDYLLTEAVKTAIESNVLGPSGNADAAQLYTALGMPDKAKKHFDAAVQGCKAYANHPVLRYLNEGSNGHLRQSSG